MAVSEESLEIPVTYQGEELLFQGELLMMGYTHKVQVEVEEQLIMFEPDEERNYRAILTEEQLQKNKKLDVALLQAIAQVLESMVK